MQRHAMRIALGAGLALFRAAELSQQHFPAYIPEEYTETAPPSTTLHSTAYDTAVLEGARRRSLPHHARI